MVNLSGRRWYAIAGAMVLLAVAAWFFSRPGEERRIRRVFDQVADAARKNNEESLVTMAMKARKLEPLLDETCSVRIPGTPLNGDYTPAELAATCIQARRMFRSCALSFHDLRIELTGPQTARAVFTARLAGVLNTGDRISEVQEMEAVLALRNGNWVFTSLQAVRTLVK